MQPQSSSAFQLAAAVSQQTQLSPTLAINERVSQLWAAGKTVYHLGFGESRFPVHPKIAAALAANVHQTSYPPTLGISDLRAAAARFYSSACAIPVAASQVIVGPGSKPLIFAAQMALDADVLLPTPSWVSKDMGLGVRANFALDNC